MSVIEIPNLRNSIAPVNAPPHMARIDSIRRPLREPAPPASLESAARPVTVKGAAMTATLNKRIGIHGDQEVPGGSSRSPAGHNPSQNAAAREGAERCERTKN